MGKHARTALTDGEGRAKGSGSGRLGWTHHGKPGHPAEVVSREGRRVCQLPRQRGAAGGAVGIPERLGGCRSLWAGLTVGDTSRGVSPLVTMVMIRPETADTIAMLSCQEQTDNYPGEQKGQSAPPGAIQAEIGLWEDSTPIGGQSPAKDPSCQVMLLTQCRLRHRCAASARGLCPSHPPPRGGLAPSPLPQTDRGAHSSCPAAALGSAECREEPPS